MKVNAALYDALARYSKAAVTNEKIQGVASVPRSVDDFWSDE